MFNRKKIKARKENLKTVNDQRLQLRNENIIYQKELMTLRDMILENNKMLKKLTEKKRTKKVVKNEQ
jgi:adenine deaminase